MTQRADAGTRPGDAPMLQIGAVARSTDLSIRTLRHYDEIGLVRPSGRSEGGFRLYTEHDVDRLLLIRRMKPLGFSLGEMSELLAIVAAHRTAPTEETSAAVRGWVGQAEERRAHLARMIVLADEFIDQLRGVEPT